MVSWSTNGVANISLFNKSGKVVAFGSNMAKPAKPLLPKITAIQSAAAPLGITHCDAVPVTLSYVLQPAPSGTDPNRKWAVLTHQFQLRNENASKWVQAHVDATKLTQGKVLHVVDFVAHASYRALGWQTQDPTRGDGIKVITDPQDLEASPEGWHTINGTPYDDTQGGHSTPTAKQTWDLGKPVFQKTTGPALNIEIDGNLVGTASQASSGSNFDFPWDEGVEPSVPTNVGLARTNAFYVTNRLHDTVYKYGFTEDSFNFQQYNFKKERG
ncbi:hypothetical protein FRC01_002857 [Tulasnella sp. 417]|nr:hypothetical protein FRC01_002857 [Tulasnella sp. 417]